MNVIFSRSKVPLPRYWRNRSFSGFEIGFTALVLFFEFWRFYLITEVTIAKIQGKMLINWLCNPFNNIRCSIFRTLEVIFSRLKLPLPKYKRKRSFADFETGFTAFAVLFLAV